MPSLVIKICDSLIGRSPAIMDKADFLQVGCGKFSFMIISDKFYNAWRTSGVESREFSQAAQSFDWCHRRSWFAILLSVAISIPTGGNRKVGHSQSQNQSPSIFDFDRCWSSVWLPKLLIKIWPPTMTIITFFGGCRRLVGNREENECSLMQFSDLAKWSIGWSIGWFKWDKLENIRRSIRSECD